MKRVQKGGVIKKLIALCCLLCFVLVATYVYRVISKPAFGTIALPKVSNSSTPAVSMKPVTIMGPYQSFDYPDLLAVEPNSPLVYPVVAMYNYTYRDVQTWDLAIEIYKISSGSFSSNSAYLYRKEHPQIFAESQKIIGDQSADIMTDTSVGDFSKLAFLSNGKYQATISLIGDDPAGTANLQNTFDMVLRTWKWRT
ncbi:MAG TPA: hypothetical protein VGS08_02825 [Candidatus Saccharimonadales bacterium]|nr:hypothetical protein [Candidatus Saccharimonadales bacterium]